MKNKTKNSQLEFVALMAALMSVVALAIDAVLPALDIIGIAIDTENVVDNQLLITMMFLGLGIGPLFFGPISDATGRKPVVYAGFGLFLVASLICVSAESLTIMIIGRVLQGIGLSAPRTIAIAIIRDLFSGDYMARIMSFVTVVFILVPVIAPALGQLILDTYNWQGIFYVQVLISLVVMLWFWKRQPETLPTEKRVRFSIQVFKTGFQEVIRYKTTMGYTIISGFVVGSFFVYLSASQQIFQLQYGLEDAFPLIFAGLSIAIGSAIFLNGTLVLKYGMEKIITTSLFGFFGVSVLYVVLFMNGSNPPLFLLLIFFSLQFFSIGFLFGNLRALAMQPVGHIAGIAAAITGFISTLLAVVLSVFIGRFVSNSVLPVFIGFLVCSTFSIGILIYVKRSR
ncbi:multidrug effflux MFS transporter [Psychroflexus planctonicus]|uniref:Bcr/CflA family drug resistance efflux transporter n=1 Tax=Psychroflexus planctonicus TaxID=1526575 RepID=A0ABQ1SFY7_9FLAO|nr:multidrug effflux MFS transporter [Psychroflexus planctonicus]GGE35382.1 Bcr/CflA family drug resistance efflux transporter [Psychroflexus planctonicus]